MKQLFSVALIASLLFAGALSAQEKSDTAKCNKKYGHTMTVSNRGIRVFRTEKKDSAISKSGKMKTSGDEEIGRFSTNIAMVDLGINLLSDNTNYSNPSVKNYLNVPASKQTKDLFDLRTGKSIDVNIYPWMIKYAAVKTKRQRIYISTGIGLQLYNFRYDEPLTYARNPAGVSLDTTSFKKDKLGLDYLNVPLMFTFKTKLYKDQWLTYGVGITEGYLIDSWNKQVSSDHGKEKIYGNFDLASFNTCLSAEVGLEGIVRFFVSYQLTNLYNNGLNQHPISFGFRFSGI